MAYTETDFDTVQQAYLELAAGKRVVKITFPGGKQIEFGQADMAALRSLRNEIQSELNQAAGSPSYFLTKTSKGL